MTTSPDLYDAALPALRSNVDGLGTWLAVWSARDDTKPDAHARRAANDAMDAIDSMLRDLHEVRAHLIGEIRASDDAADARADALLRGWDGGPR